MATMTSRERVLRTVNFQETDRVPIDLGGMKATGITVRAYNQLKAQLGLRTQTRIWDPKFMIASVEEDGHAAIPSGCRPAGYFVGRTGYGA